MTILLFAGNLLAAALLGTGVGEEPLFSRHTGSVAQAQAPCRPLRLGLIWDQSGSTLEHRVPAADRFLFARVVEHLARCGGEVAVAFVRETTPGPLIRLYVDAAPPAPPRPDSSSSVWVRNQSRSSFERDSVAWVDAKAQWELDFRHRSAEFYRLLEAHVTRSADAPRTALCDVIRRVDVFTREPARARQASIHIMASTDGLSNIGSPCPDLADEVVFVLANGNGVVGVLARYQPIVFESPESALDWIFNGGIVP